MFYSVEIRLRIPVNLYWQLL